MTNEVKKPKIKAPKKLIEVALPLDAINVASAREKSIRHGHPSTLHLWWARRPLAAARAVLFAQLVNDPGGDRGWGKYKGQTKEDAAKERQRLFRLIEQLVQWENTNNEELLEQAREEIRKSWRETCELNKGVPGFDPEKLPPFHDPFAGGGTIPLEAQRLGLEAHASDLNPVAVLINKAMIEIPPKFAGRPPVGPVPKEEKQTKSKATEDWSGTKGLAEDVRRYGAWMREEAFKKIGHLYPPVKITAEMAKGRPDLKPYVGQERTVIAWLWCRTVASPNPAMGGAHVPLISSYWLSSKKGKESYLEPVIKGKTWHLVVRRGRPKDTKSVEAGTKSGRGQFVCLLSGTAIPPDHIRDEGLNSRLSARMTAVVVDAGRERVFLEPSQEHAKSSDISVDQSTGTKLPDKALGFRVQRYGILSHDDLFTSRQRKLLFTFSDIVDTARKKGSSGEFVSRGPCYAAEASAGRVMGGRERVGLELVGDVRDELCASRGQEPGSRRLRAYGHSASRGSEDGVATPPPHSQQPRCSSRLCSTTSRNTRASSTTT
ncbi:MAG: DUF1156 domain-containing protein [Myxococcales bacterium]|nr:DUF1156 domain-containing protein [Myxococcales bacterium]